MDQSIKDFLEVETSENSSRTRLKHRKGLVKVVVQEGVDIDLDKIVEENRDWLEDKVSKARRFRDEVPERVFEQGAYFSVLGKERELVVEKRRSNSLEEERIFLAEHLVTQTCFKDQLEKALREYCREVIHEKLEAYTERISGDYGKVFIRDQGTRWGSCSSKNNLNFNWRLILGPEHVLDYVVVHEIVHLEIPNHSEEFWSRVEELRPDYRESSNWLEENSARLVFDPDFS